MAAALHHGEPTLSGGPNSSLQQSSATAHTSGDDVCVPLYEPTEEDDEEATVSLSSSEYESDESHTDLSPSSSSSSSSSFPPSPVQTRRDLVILAFVCVALIASWIFDNVAWIYLSDRMGQTYAFSLNLMMFVLCVAIQAPVLLYYVHTGAIPREEVTALPWTTLLLMAGVDSVYNTLLTLGSPHTPGPFQTILFQLPIPITMVAAYLIQRRRFRLGQYVGGLIILGGAILTVLPGIIDVLRGRQTSDGTQTKPASVLVYVVSILFFSGNTLYKESVLKRTKVHVWALSISLSAISFCCTFLLIPALWIPGVGVDTPSSTFPHIAAGIRCVFTGRSTMDPEAQCETIWWLMLVNAFSIIVVNFLALVMLRRGSALLMQAASGVQLPLCNLFYASKFVMGSLVTPMTKFMVRHDHTRRSTLLGAPDRARIMIPVAHTSCWSSCVVSPFLFLRSGPVSARSALASSSTPSSRSRVTSFALATVSVVARRRRRCFNSPSRRVHRRITSPRRC